MPNQPPQPLSVAEAATLPSCSRDHVYNLIAAGELSAVAFKAKGARPDLRRLP